MVEAGASEQLRDAIKALLQRRGIRHGNGPAMAWIETVDGKRYVYVSFGMDGPKEPSEPHRTSATLSDLIAIACRNFDNWLQASRTLVWRTPPEVDEQNGRYKCFFRCVQIDDDADHIDLRWHL